MLEHDGKMVLRQDDISETLSRVVKQELKLKSHHVPRHQLDVSQLCGALAKVAAQEFSSAASSPSAHQVDSYLAKSLTKGGSIVVLNTFYNHVAQNLLRQNFHRHPQSQQYSLHTPRTSLESLFTFFRSRVTKQ